jgi:hypothetical protein
MRMCVCVCECVRVCASVRADTSAAGGSKCGGSKCLSHYAHISFSLSILSPPFLFHYFPLSSTLSLSLLERIRVAPGCNAGTGLRTGVKRT